MFLYLYKQEYNKRCEYYKITLLVVEAAAVDGVAEERKQLNNDPEYDHFADPEGYHTGKGVYRNKGAEAEEGIGDLLGSLHPSFSEGKKESNRRRNTRNYPKDKPAYVFGATPEGCSLSGIYLNKILVVGCHTNYQCHGNRRRPTAEYIIITDYSIDGSHNQNQDKGI